MGWAGCAAEAQAAAVLGAGYRLVAPGPGSVAAAEHHGSNVPPQGASTRTGHPSPPPLAAGSRAPAHQQPVSSRTRNAPYLGPPWPAPVPPSSGPGGTQGPGAAARPGAVRRGPAAPGMGRRQHHLLVRGPARRGSRHPPADTPRAGVGRCRGCGEQRVSGIEAQIAPGAEPHGRGGRTAGTDLPAALGEPGGGRVRAASAAGRPSRALPAVPAGLPAVGTPSRSSQCPCGATCAPRPPQPGPGKRRERTRCLPRRQVPEPGALGGAPQSGLGPGEFRRQRRLPWKSPLPSRLSAPRNASSPSPCPAASPGLPGHAVTVQ